MSRRSRARAVVLQVLYEDDLNPLHDLLASDQFLLRRLHQDEVLVEFARELLAGVRRNRLELDRLLGEAATHWSLGRMAVTDRNALRLARGQRRVLSQPTVNKRQDCSHSRRNKHDGEQHHDQRCT